MNLPLNKILLMKNLQLSNLPFRQSLSGEAVVKEYILKLTYCSYCS